jgi:hypothetical protein
MYSAADESFDILDARLDSALLDGVNTGPDSKQAILLEIFQVTGLALDQ